MPKRSKPPAPPAKRGRGRPPSANPASTTFQLRTTPERRAVWQASAAASGQGESEWAREGLDAWVRFCTRAAELNTNPSELVDAALEDHARVRAAVAELAVVRTLSLTESRLLRVLAPIEWARVSRSE